MLKKANSDLVRRQNRGLVLETLRQHGPLARITLGYQTGLSPASITSISGQLIDEGLVYSIVEDEEVSTQAKRGRPQTRLALNPQATNVLAIAISIDGVELVFADFSGATREPVKLRLDIYPIPKEEFGIRIAQEIKSNAKRLGIALNSIKRIGVAVQGVADTITGEISWSPAFRARDIPVVRPLERLLDIPCSIANNANMIAEALLGMDRKRYGGTTAVVFMGHGIGLGLILNGSVYSGATGRAAEFGHMNHMPEGPLCRCGRHGCLEAFSADYGIMRMANDRRGTDFDIHAPVLDSDLRELELAAEAGDAVAVNAFLRAGEVLGFGIARLIALINPQRVVLAGPGTRAYGLMKDSLEEALRRGLVHDLRKNIEFEVVPYGKDMITTGTLVETLRHLDRDVYATGQKATIIEFSGEENCMRKLLFAAVVMLAWFGALGTAAQASTKPAEEVLRTWYQLVLELVRHTPTYSPPVASRSFAYLGVAAFEAAATGSSEMQSLAGQLNGLTPVPQREAGKTYDEAVVLQAAMAFAVQNFFENTGPTGQRAVASLEAKLRSEATAGLPADVAVRSEEYGRSVAEHVLAWSRDDGGAVIVNMGFPLEYELTMGPANWVPTNVIAQQQKPLLPNWGKNRTFAIPNGAACELPAPPEYSEDKASQFYKQALEVFEAKQNLSPEQRAIARFWSDDPMLSPTPPGHWISIALQIFERDKVALDKSVDVLARIGIAEADAFIGCWDSKFQYDLLRPVTYIRRTIDPKWESLINTPPFPEYPSGHSTQSGAAAVVLTNMFGENFAFEDATHARDGIKPRAYPSFWAAAEEAGISRLYGGIHFRAAIDRGLEQGRCIGAFVNSLRTRK